MREEHMIRDERRKGVKGIQKRMREDDERREGKRRKGKNKRSGQFKRIREESTEERIRKRFVCWLVFLL